MNKFRLETRTWLEANCPHGARGPGQIPWGSRRVPLEPDTKLWLMGMAERGWTVPTWPKEYGGAELTREQYLALEKQDWRYDVGVKYGLLTAQLALALNGNDRDEVLSLLLELLALRELGTGGR